MNPSKAPTWDLSLSDSQERERAQCHAHPPCGALVAPAQGAQGGAPGVQGGGGHCSIFVATAIFSKHDKRLEWLMRVLLTSGRWLSQLVPAPSLICKESKPICLKVSWADDDPQNLLNQAQTAEIVVNRFHSHNTLMISWREGYNSLQLVGWGGDQGLVMTKVSHGLAALLLFCPLPHCTVFWRLIFQRRQHRRECNKASAIVAAKGADIETLSQLLHLSTNCPPPLPIKTQ